MRVLLFVYIGIATVGAIAFRSLPQQDSTIPYENAGKSLPVLEALTHEHVTFLRIQDWCRAYSDNQEQRATELTSTCTLAKACSTSTAGCGSYKLFDNASETRFAELRSKLKGLPYDVHWIKIEYGPDGALRTAELAINTADQFRRDALIYNPGYVLPEDIPGEVVNHRIDSDWYYRWEDWN